MSNTKSLLGKKIRQLRMSNNLTQEQLAEAIGIGTPNISYFETGKYAPSFDTLEKMAKIFNVEIYEFFMFQQYKSYDEIKKELSEVINNNENLSKELYKFYLVIK